MAELLVVGARLVLRLNALEKVMDLRVKNVSVPVAAITAIETVRNPHQDLLDEINFGFAANTAPGRAILCLMTRAKFGGGRAAVAVYLNRPAVVVRLSVNETPWRLIAVSSRRAEAQAVQLRASSTADPRDRLN